MPAISERVDRGAGRTRARVLGSYVDGWRRVWRAPAVTVGVLLATWLITPAISSDLGGSFFGIVVQETAPALTPADWSVAVMPPREHVFVCGGCAPPAGGSSLSPESIAFLQASARLGPEAASRLPLSPGAVRELETAHRRLINLHLEKELKSARVIRDMRQAR
jgi:hypothetical protein